MNRPIDRARLLARDKVSVARALSLADDSRPGADERLRELLTQLPEPGEHARIGITGPPGVGKSTLVSALARIYRARGQSVGVLAVDPSSVRSGGALLGDRLRIAPDAVDPGLFVRSLATRGEAGGLARTVPAAARILAALYERTLVETVGVGQNETDVRDVVDTVVLVIQPGSGDALQFLKAGIMEVPDILVVNKADQDELARRAETELRSAIHALAAANVAERTPVLRTSAQSGQGVEALVGLLDDRDRELRLATAGESELAILRRQQRLRLDERRFVRLYGTRGVEAVGGADALRARLATALTEASDTLPRLDVHLV